jgi:MFS family permease
VSEAPVNSGPVGVAPPPTPQSEEQLPEIYRLPTNSLSWTFRLLFGLASIVTGMVQVTVKQIVLPAQVALFVPELASRNTTYAIIASIGALAGVLISPLAGAISDRTTMRLGRRRPWILIGLVLGLLGMVLMAKSYALLPLLLGEIIVQIAFDTIMSATTAIIPDQVPVHQRPTVSALIGMSPIVGGLVGTILVAKLSHPAQSPWQSYLILGIAACVVVLPFFIILREKPLQKELVPAFSFKGFLAHFWVNPVKHPDFGFTWFSRCLIFLAYTILVSYMTFYLHDVIHFANPANGVALFNVFSTVILVVAAIIGGLVAEKLQALKPFVIVGALIMAVTFVVIAFVHSWPIMLVCAFVMGIGFGIYLSIDIVLAVRVLPAAGDRGKDLGIINTAIFLPLIFSTLIGSPILNAFGPQHIAAGYTTLFCLSAGFLVLAAILILPIKSVR